MQWMLQIVKSTDCTMDDSGIYTIINRVVKKETHKEYGGERVLVRVDVMRDKTDKPVSPDKQGDRPIRSFIGQPNDVRKTVIAFLTVGLWDGTKCRSIIRFSREHASYIGYEIARAEADSNYIQD